MERRSRHLPAANEPHRPVTVRPILKALDRPARLVACTLDGKIFFQEGVEFGFTAKKA